MEGESLITDWRLAYNLPPNDPRYLDADEEMILHDLVVRRFYGEHERRLANPGAAAAEDEAGRPELEAQLEKIREAIASDPRIAAAIRGKGDPETPRPTRARVVTALPGQKAPVKP